MNILETSGLTKRFGGVTAINQLDLVVEEGSITALIGPNGSGKTTFINLTSGVYRATEGKIVFRGRDITNLEKHQIARLGIGRTFQTIHLFERMTALQNVMVARHKSYDSNLLDVFFTTRRLAEEEKREREKAIELLDMVGLKGMYDQYPSSLPYGFRRSLEIARALALDPSFLLLDEPAAGMNRDEFFFLQEIILRINRQGLTILLVEHTMELVESVADRVVVLNYGKKLAEGSFREIEASPEVIEAYLGREEL